MNPPILPAPLRRGGPPPGGRAGAGGGRGPPPPRPPPVYPPFSRWASDLALLVDAVPASGATVAVYYGKMHTVDATSSTLPSALEEAAVTGAAAYAALAWASFAINRVNVGGADTWRSLYTWGQERLPPVGGGPPPPPPPQPPPR